MLIQVNLMSLYIKEYNDILPEIDIYTDEFCIDDDIYYFDFKYSEIQSLIQNTVDSMYNYIIYKFRAENNESIVFDNLHIYYNDRYYCIQVVIN